MLKSDSDNASFYDDDSQTYDRTRWTTAGGSYTNRVEQEIVRELVRGWGGVPVLEVGPGTGRFTTQLAKCGSRVTLCDLSRGMLEVVRRNLEAAGCDRAIDAMVEGSLYELPFKNGTFDHALAVNVFNHLEDTARAVGELARVVKPDGYILFTYANLRSWYWLGGLIVNRRRAAFGRSVYSRCEHPGVVRRAIADAGLELVQRIGHTHVPKGLERLGVLPLIAVLDRMSRKGFFSEFAPIHYCQCRKLATVAAGSR